MAVTWSSVSWRKSLYAAPTAKKGSGIAGQTTRSATAPTERTADREATGTATMIFAGALGRSAATAASIVEPVARPSSTTITSALVTVGASPPRASLAALQLGKLCRPYGFERRVQDAKITNHVSIAEQRHVVANHRQRTHRELPMAGTPSLRTKITPSGAESRAATSAATGTPPRGRASTTGALGRRRAAGSAANTRPASVRSAKRLSCRAPRWLSVDVDRLGGDLAPVELFDAALPAGAAELLSLFRIPGQGIDLGGQPLLEGCYRCRVVGPSRVVGNQIAGFAVDHHLRDPPTADATTAVSQP